MLTVKHNETTRKMTQDNKTIYYKTRTQNSNDTIRSNMI